jgi:hypothetical protein
MLKLMARMLMLLCCRLLSYKGMLVVLAKLQYKAAAAGVASVGCGYSAVEAACWGLLWAQAVATAVAAAADS